MEGRVAEDMTTWFRISIGTVSSKMTTCPVLRSTLCIEIFRLKGMSLNKLFRVSTSPPALAMLFFHSGSKKMVGQNFQKSYGSFDKYKS